MKRGGGRKVGEKEGYIQKTYKREEKREVIKYMRRERKERCEREEQTRGKSLPLCPPLFAYKPTLKKAGSGENERRKDEGKGRRKRVKRMDVKKRDVYCIMKKKTGEKKRL